MAGGGDERGDLGQRQAEAGEVVHAQLAVAAGGEDGGHRFQADAGDTEQHLLRGRVDVDRELFAVGERPGELGVDREIEIAGRVRLEFGCCEAVVPHEPIGLIQPVLAHQRRMVGRQAGGGVRDRAERTVVDPAQAICAVEVGAHGQDVAVRTGVGADDHLRALTGGGEARAAAVGLGLVDAQAHAAHGAADAGQVLLGGEGGEAAFGGEFHVDGQAVGVFAGLEQQGRVGVGDGFQVDVAAEAVLLAQGAGDADDLLHGVVGVADDAGGEEQPLDAVAAVEAEGEGDDLLHGEAGAAHVGGAAVDAVQTVVDAGIGQQDLQQGDAAAVRCVGVADAHAFGRAHAVLFAGGTTLFRAAGGAGRVVFRGVGQDL